MDQIEHFRQVDLSLWDVFAKVEESVKTKIALIHVFGKEANKAFVVTSDDEVFAVGHNNLGVLGIGETDRAEQLIKIEELCHKSVIQFSASDNCAVALTRDNQVFYWGGYNVKETKPERVHDGNRYGGGSYDDGYGGGGGGWNRKRGQQGGGAAGGGGARGGSDTGSASSPIYWSKNPIPLKLPKNVAIKPVQVLCLDTSFAFLTSDNQVFEWGKTSMNDEVKHPKLVPFPPGIIPTYITSGGTFTMAVTKCRKVFAWGSYISGPFMMSGFSRSQPRSAIYLDEVKLVKVVSHGGETVFLSETGDVHVHYQGMKGTEILNIKDVKNIEVSPAANLFAAITKKGVAYIWGKEGMLDYNDPVRSRYSNLQEVFAGFATPSVFRARALKRKREEDEDGVKDEDQVNGTEKDHPNAGLFNDKDHSNLTIILKGETVFVNKAILIQSCPHFKTVLHGLKTNTLEIEDYTSEVYKAFLKYLYTGTLEKVNGVQCIELMQLAETYNDETLKSRCLELFRDSLKETNAVELFSQCVEEGSKELEELCAQYIEKCLKENPLDTSIFPALANETGQTLAATIKRIKEA